MSQGTRSDEQIQIKSSASLRYVRHYAAQVIALALCKPKPPSVAILVVAWAQIPLG